MDDSGVAEEVLAPSVSKTRGRVGLALGARMGVVILGVTTVSVPDAVFGSAVCGLGISPRLEAMPDGVDLSTSGCVFVVEPIVC